MRKRLLLIAALLLAASCGTDREVGQRYRAERDLSRANWEYRELSIRPDRVTDDDWTALARHYESIADKYAGTPDVRAAGTPKGDAQTVAARALFAAAQIHAALRDSNRVEALYERMAQDFGQLPAVAAEVAMIRGGTAERRGDLLAAADLYQSAVDRVEPQAGAAGVAGMVLDLPLRIARLRTQGALGPAKEAPYAAARAYYERQARDNTDALVRTDARVDLAEIAADFGRWDEAIAILRDLETQLRETKDPPRSPCEMRFAVYGVQSRAGLDLAFTKQTLTSLLDDYPDCELASQVLLALASNANRRGQVDEALGYLDRIVNEHRADPQTASQSLLGRGRLLESNGRWQEALDTYRSIPIQFPVSEGALQAPLEIVLHYARAGDDEAAKAALSQAESDYQDFIVRYPPGSLTEIAREHLAQTLMLQDKFDPAIMELIKLGDALTGTPKGASSLLTAARIACIELADTTRAIEILDHVAKIYARATVGKWASDEATRLRGLMSS
jgi:tetratricopeptide (TPR) repeat protein